MVPTQIIGAAQFKPFLGHNVRERLLCWCILSTAFDAHLIPLWIRHIEKTQAIFKAVIWYSQFSFPFAIFVVVVVDRNVTCFVHYVRVFAFGYPGIPKNQNISSWEEFLDF